MNKRIYSSLLILALMGVCSTPSFAGPSPKHTVTIKAGATGDDVKYIQAFLVSKGWDMKDATYGTFDEATQKKLAEVIPAAKNRDGSVSAGTGTWRKIEAGLPEATVKTKIAEIDKKVSDDKAAEVAKKQKEENDDKRTYSLSASDLSDAGFTISFDSSGVLVNGSIPQVCKDKLSISSSTETPTADEDSDTEESKSLDQRSTKIRLKVTFEGSDKLHDDLTSLKKCLDAHKSEGKLSVSQAVSFDGNESLGIVQFYEDGSWKDSSPKIVSPRYSKLSRLAKDADCKTCNTLKKTKSRIEELTNLNESSMSSITKTLIENGVDKIGEAIDSASSIADLERARNDLMSFAKSAYKLEDERSELMEKIGKEFTHLLERNGALAKEAHASCGKESSSFYESSTCESESKFADFASKTFKEMASTPGLPKENRDHYRARSKEFASGGLERVKFIASINPVNEEVTDALSTSKSDLRAMAIQYNRQCRFQSAQGPTPGCEQMKQQYLDVAKTYDDLYQQRLAAVGVPSYGLSPFGVGYGVNANQFGPGSSGGLPQLGYGQMGQNGMFRPMNAPYGMMQQGQFPQGQFGQFPQNQGMMFNAPQMNGMQQFNAPLMANNGQVVAIPVSNDGLNFGQNQFQTIR